MKSITKIVLTGGPCSGKSTFIDMATDIFSKKGYRVFVDHESATDLITGGISPATMGMYNFQKYCIELQKKKEELFCMAADEINAEKVLIFYDRGILDDKGYVTPEEFTEILQSLDIDESTLCDRYDMVLHLTTTAMNNTQFYTFVNNAARYEGIEEARKIDKTILDSWAVHPNRVVIKDEESFDTKIQNAIKAVGEYIVRKH
ncbi:MAG: ATP-binding protein [Oscillospiraceae bacterium]|nr:ATP-binding protein [Oscillospiraceae bacterium]